MFNHNQAELIFFPRPRHFVRANGNLGEHSPDLPARIRAICPTEIFMWAVKILLQGIPTKESFPVRVVVSISVFDIVINQQQASTVASQ